MRRRNLQTWADLTDEQACKVWFAWGSNCKCCNEPPNGAKIDWIRNELGPWFNAADLEHMQHQFELDAEHELASFIRRQLATLN
jgi:hypothetical protein